MRATPSLASQASRSSAQEHAVAPHRSSTSTPEAPAWQATSVWASNVASSTPAEDDPPPDRRRFVEFLAGLERAVEVCHRGVVGELAPRMSPPSAVSRRAVRTTTSRRASPPSSSGLIDGEAERLEEERKNGVGTGLRDLDEQVLLARGVLRVGVVRAEARRRRHPCAWPAPRRSRGAGGSRGRSSDPSSRGLDGHDEPGGAGQGPFADGLPGAEVRVQQDVVGRLHDGAHDGPLASTSGLHTSPRPDPSGPASGAGRRGGRVPGPTACPCRRHRASSRAWRSI